ncbi:hypothetical protein T02_7288 [Trichinella nativa]|uniref:Uncharacterized protein n=1 Tax=Trichinella nativa TaxID=6335 RepID=A0A0V1LM94_9BILA|nr:hypothetical protein T02_7288 [Trichinella nativa]
MSCNNTKSGSSKCTVILSVMYHRNVSGGFSYDLCALLIAGAFLLVSVVFRAIHFFICFCSTPFKISFPDQEDFSKYKRINKSQGSKYNSEAKMTPNHLYMLRNFDIFELIFYNSNLKDSSCQVSVGDDYDDADDDENSFPFLEYKA